MESNNNHRESYQNEIIGLELSSSLGLREIDFDDEDDSSTLTFNSDEINHSAKKPSTPSTHTVPKESSPTTVTFVNELENQSLPRTTIERRRPVSRGHESGKDIDRENDNENENDLVVNFDTMAQIDTKQSSDLDEDSIDDDVEEPPKSKESGARDKVFRHWKRRRRCKRVCIGFLIAIIPILLLFILVVTIGYAVERRRVRGVPPITYDTASVCATVGGSDASFNHYDAPQMAYEEGEFVAHCGNCGKCSNPNDLFEMSYPTNFLDVQIAACSWHVLWGGTDRCLRKRVKFTEACHTCWSQFTKCSIRKCKFSCFVNRFTDDETCVDCREKLCGASLLDCSGVDRKRLGFIDYAHHNTTGQICEHVDYYWQ